MNERERWRDIARGLTLLNIGLGLSFWAGVWYMIGAKWNLVALFLTPGGFLVVLGLVYGGHVPGERRVAPLAWLAAVGFGLFYVWALYELMATEEHEFSVPSLIFAGAGMVLSLAYFWFLIDSCRRRIIRKGAALPAWWLTAGSIAVTAIVRVWILPELDIAPETHLLSAGMFDLFTLAAYCNVVIKTRTMVAGLAKEPRTE